MPSLIHRIRRADLVAAVALFVAGGVLTGLGSYERYVFEVPLWFRFVPLAAVCLGVVIRRAFPGGCLTLGVLAFGTELAVGLTLATVCIFTDNLYAYARYGTRSRIRWVLVGTGGFLGAFIVWAALGGADAGDILSTAAVGAVVLISPLATGFIVRQANDRAGLEAERAEQADRLADVRRREAVLRERAAMARELHDTVANYLSAIALQATGLQARKRLDAATTERSVAAIRQSSVEGLAELRRIIGILRAGESGEELSSHRLDQLPELVDRMRRFGLAVEADIEPPPVPLPGEVEAAAFRVVQEALVNVLKYGADARLSIAYDTDCLNVTVANTIADGAEDADEPEPAAVLGSGAGLVGMTERVRLLGGAVHAGPSEGHWLVRAEIPTGAHSDHSPAR